MILYNKVEDIYHTSMRLITHLKFMKNNQTDLKTLILIDFILCFPQYREELSKKRKLKFLKLDKTFYKYDGALASHKFLLEKTITGAVKLLYAKKIISFNKDQIILIDKNDLPIFTPEPELKELYNYINTESIELINKELRLFEGKYEKIPNH